MAAEVQEPESEPNGSIFDIAERLERDEELAQAAAAAAEVPEPAPAPAPEPEVKHAPSSPPKKRLRTSARLAAADSSGVTAADRFRQNIEKHNEAMREMGFDPDEEDELGDGKEQKEEADALFDAAQGEPEEGDPDEEPEAEWDPNAADSEEEREKKGERTHSEDEMEISPDEIAREERRAEKRLAAEAAEADATADDGAADEPEPEEGEGDEGDA